jgi:putative ABC transport system substrate-binding protein
VPFPSDSVYAVGGEVLNLVVCMRRREFIATLGGAVAFPLAAHAQTERTRRIGALVAFAENDAEGQVRVAAFRRRLQELGWSEGHNLQIDFRYVGGDVERMRPAAAELVALTPDVIFVHSNPGVAALQQVNRTIPAVFAQIADPVGSGFIDNLAHPGGNITGFSVFEAEIGSKWLEILKEVAPTVTHAVVLLHTQTAANVAILHAAETASTSLGITVTSAGVQDAAEIASAFETFAAPNSGFLLMPHFVTVSNRVLIGELAIRHRIPTVAPFRFMAASGSLVSYGVDVVDLFRRAASYVDLILRGAKPAELPVQEPTKYELVVNLKTAKAIGLTVPATLLARADGVIE